VNPNAATLRLAVFPRTGLLADAVLVVAGAALVALAAQVRIPFDPVPITGSTFAVLLVGASLGAVRAMSSLSLYVAVGVLGAPVYTGQNSGWEYFTGATGGYLVGFVLAAAVVGYLAERGWDRRLSSAIAAMLTGSVLIYAVGLPWLAVTADLDFAQTLEKGLALFVPGDLLKLYLAAALLPTAWRAVERFRGR
jgi:biotin transport system substrate-specific component